MKRNSQADQVIEALRIAGGYATLRRLNELVDFSSWATKTPEASIRRIVQQNDAIFKIRPGLWALEEARNMVLRKFNLKIGDRQSEEMFSHGYYQGLLLEIGRLKRFSTYVPAQDKNRLFLGQHLSDLADTVAMPSFTYDELLRKARTINVVWFNERHMPSSFYEVEHTTDIKNSLSKFYELQDFHAKFFIVADKSRTDEFADKMSVSMFQPLWGRVEFLTYERVSQMHSTMKIVDKIQW